jgi:hypothetical protein
MTSGEASVLLLFIGGAMTGFGGIAIAEPQAWKAGRIVVGVGIIFMLPALLKLWALAVMG